MSGPSFNSSSSWREPNVVVSHDQRVSIAQDGLEASLSHVDSTSGLFITPEGTEPPAFGIHARLYSQLATFDQITGGKRYRDVVLAGIQAASQERTQFLDPFINSGVTWGIAAAQAYEVYGDPEFLELATVAWSFGNDFLVTQEQIASGSTSVKNFPLKDICRSVTLAGGVFWTNDTSNPILNGISTGAFFVASSLLAKLTSNDTYNQAALSSGDFLRNQLSNTQNIVQDSISARRNDSCQSSSGTFPVDSGLFVQGLSILGTFNSTYQDLLNSTIEAVVPFPAWQGSDGIISQSGSKNGDGTLVRGLAEAYIRNPQNVPLRNYLKAYISVQYNAILTFATASNSNNYSLTWHGPAATTFSPTDQVEALDVLVPVVALTNEMSTSTSPPSSGLSHSSPNVAAIVGGVVGSLVAVLLILLFWLLLRRWRRRRGIEGDYTFCGLRRKRDPYPHSEPFNPPSMRSVPQWRKSNLHSTDQGQNQPITTTFTESTTALTGATPSNTQSPISRTVASPVDTRPREKPRAATAHNSSAPASASSPQRSAATQTSASQASSRPQENDPVASVTSEVTLSERRGAALNSNPPNNLSISELVHLLNQRLQQSRDMDDIDEDEVPPEYASQGAR